MLPKITIVIVTLNNGRTIGECVRTIMNQDYPKHLIEYLNVDGGSQDATKKILRKNKFRMIDSPIKNAEAQRAIGLKHAKNDLIVSIDADNYLPHKKWISQMVRPFLENKDIVHAGTLHFTYRKNDPSSFNRYVALFGVVDPTVYYIGKPDRVPWFRNKWSGGDILKETPEYYIVRFTKNTLPTVGCNGVAYRRGILLKNAHADPSKFIHIDVFADLFEKGYDKYAVVKNDVIHDTAINLRALMKKRIAFLHAYYLHTNKNGLKRRYFIYNPNKLQDVFKLFMFILFTITFVKPLIDSTRGYLVKRDGAWFLHPVMCWIYLYAYVLVTFKKFLAIK